MLLRQIAELEQRLAVCEAERTANSVPPESETRIRTLVRAIPDLILRVNRAGHILFFKPSREATPGMPQGNFVGRDVRHVMPAWAAKNLQQIERLLETGGVLTTTYAFRVGDQVRHHECQLGTSGEDEVVAVVRDVTARLRVEEERQRLQEVLIHAQAAALAELSTPVIPIHDQVFVVPLIGTIDAQRAESVISTLLDGVMAHKARVAILDITGVPVMDSQVADALARAAHATSLVGARLVVTGMQPKVARALVELGANLTGIVTHGTLQSGIAYAMGAIGKSTAAASRPIPSR